MPLPVTVGLLHLQCGHVLGLVGPLVIGHAVKDPLALSIGVAQHTINTRQRDADSRADYPPLLKLLICSEN